MILDKQTLLQSLASARASIKSRYRQSFAGFLWVIINPIVMFATQSLVFKHILKLDIPKFYLFLLSGLLPWLFLVQSIEMTSSSFLTNGRITKAYSVSPIVFLTAQLIDNLVNFLMAMFVLLTVVAFLDPIPFSAFLGFIPSMIFLVTALWGLSIGIATLQVFYKDTKFVVSFVLSIGFYLTPIFYSEEFLPPGFEWLPKVNPLYYLIKPIRMSFLGHHPLTLGLEYLQAFAVAVFFLSTTTWYWNKKKNQVYMNV